MNPGESRWASNAKLPSVKIVFVIYRVQLRQLCRCSEMVSVARGGLGQRLRRTAATQSFHRQFLICRESVNRCHSNTVKKKRSVSRRARPIFPDLHWGSFAEWEM